MSSSRLRLTPQFLIASLLVALTLVTYSPKKSEAVGSSNPNKITICHRTHATTNPYRRITVNKNSIFNGNPASSLDDPNANGNGHGRFQHNDWPGSDANPVTARPVPNVYNPSTTYQSNKKRWGDIIPDRLDDGSQINSRTAMPLNYTLAGLAIWNNQSYNGNAAYADMCKRKSAKQYCDAEIPALVAAGRTQAQAESDCMADLAEQESYDDAPLLNACNGNIATCDISKLSVVGVSTGTTSCTATDVTMNANVNMGSTSGDATFEYGTTNALGTSVAATPGTVTGSVNFSTTVTLSDTTYYYRAVVSTADGGVLEGDIESFTKSSSVCASSATTTTTTVAASTTTTVAATTTTIGSSGVTTTTAPVNANSGTTTTVPAGGYKGALRGIVWIDKNLNELQDSDEPGIPFTPMVATLVTSYVGGTPGTKLTFKTDGLGKYSVPSLEPGKWDVHATLITDALTRTFDTNDGVGIQSVRAASLNDGSVQATGVHKAEVIDWQAKATVPINGLGVADFAAAGDAVLKVAIEVPAACVKSEYVEITWAGYDLKLGTADDATFKVKVTDKEAVAKRIPYGAYSVTPLCTSGVKLLAEQTVLRKKQVRTLSVNATILPETGQHSSRGIAEIGLAMLLVGCFLGVRRRIFG